MFALSLDLSGTDPGDALALLARAEGAGVDLVTLADSHVGPGPRLDAVMLANFLAARVTGLGILPTVNTTVTEPFLVASQIATLDFVSSGFGGVLVSVSGEPADAGYVGPRDVALGDAAWDEAAEFVEVLRRLWDSWEDGAEIRDAVKHRFLDRERVHHIDFAGEHFSVKGPSITPRPPQGQPPVAVSVGEDRRALALAAAQADVVFTRLDAEVVREAVRGAGREPSSVRVLADGVASEGYDGVRVSAEGLEARDRRADAGSLRERLGLARPFSRYAA